MRLLVNEGNSTIILTRADGGTIKLRPKGQDGDKKEIDDKTAGSEAVQRFLTAKKVSLLSAEQASARTATAAPRKVAPTPVAKKEAPKPKPVEPPKAMPKPKPVEPPKVVKKVEKKVEKKPEEKKLEKKPEEKKLEKKPEEKKVAPAEDTKPAKKENSNDSYRGTSKKKKR